MPPRRRLCFALLIVLLAACSTSTPLPTLTSLPTETLIPSTSTPEPTPTATPVPAPPRPQYTMNVVLDYVAKTVQTDEIILYPNHTSQPQTNLVMAVEPNLWPDCFTLNSLSLDGTQVDNFTLDGQKLTVPLPAVLQPEATITVQLQFSLNLPEIEPTNPDLTRPRIFGYSQRQINLTNWYPFVVPFMGGDWVLHDPWYYGEHLVYDASDFTVTIRLANPAVSPVIAASGAPMPGGDPNNGTTYTLTSGRTFAVSASTEFQTSEVQVGDVVVTSYFFPTYEGAGKAAMNAAAQALEVYSQRYGPYTHQTLAVVMGDFNDGMEFSAFFFLSRDFYNLYDGTPKNYLIFVAAHETAHQWWFEQVADDQALQPWLDESLATYSERVFYESTDPGLVSWWWAYRVDYYQPQGWVDIPVYEGQGFRPYTNAVYFRGAHFLEDLRGRIGDQAFFAFLQDYLTQENGKIATSADFFRILAQHTSTDYSDIVRNYFRNSY